MIDRESGPIVELDWYGFDLRKHSVLDKESMFVKPSELFTVPEEFTKNTGITQEDIQGGLSIKDVLSKFNESCFFKYTQQNLSFCLVVMNDELLTKILPYQVKDFNIKLPHYFSKYYDLLQQFKRFYAQTDGVSNVETMLQYLMLRQLSSEKVGQLETKNMVRIVNKMVKDSHRFMNPKILDHNYKIIAGHQDSLPIRKPNYKKWSAYIRSRSPEPFKNPSRQFVVKMRGLPYQAREPEVMEFCRGLRVRTTNIAFLYGGDGKFTGQCYVRFLNSSDFQEGLSLHNGHMGDRYIEIYEASESDFESALNSQSPDAKNSYYFNPAMMEQLSETTGVLKVEQLPLAATDEDIRILFAGFNLHDQNSIKRSIRNGKPSGEAFVLFTTQDDALMALAQNPGKVGNRQVQVRASSVSEYENFLHHNFVNSAPAYSRDRMPNIPLEKRKSTLLVTGLPYEITREELLNFFKEFNLLQEEVHMINNNNEKFSGTALIGFEDEMEAQKAMKTKNLNYIRNRYVELFEYR